jgi:hypothetical protein
MKKVVTGFLNGAAVALLVSGCLAPALANTPGALSALIAVGLSFALHVLALEIARRVED